MKFFTSVVLCAIFLAIAVSVEAYPSRLETLKSGWGPENVTQHSGYFSVGPDNGGHLFFWMFEKRGASAEEVAAADTPLIMWLSGGPGCSSELALFFENGPYHVDDQARPSINPASWNIAGNLLFVDQPVGTGFSYADSQNDYVTNEKQVAEDMYEFLQAFFKAFPQYSSNAFFVTGESYAGHYVPAISNRIFTGNNNGDGAKINLKGFAIGNGLTDPVIQYQDYGTFAFDNKLINVQQYSEINSTTRSCIQLIKEGSPLAMMVCNGIMDAVINDAGGICPYDIRMKNLRPPLCYDFTGVNKLMNDPSVQASLGVPSGSQWESCNDEVHLFLNGDWMTDCAPYIPPMLEAGIRGLIYAGTDDFICNWYGNRHWVEELKWSGQSEYNSKDFRQWTGPSGKPAGLTKAAGQLRFTAVFGAGHMVPHDQPAVALQMINDFVTNTPY